MYLLLDECCGRSLVGLAAGLGHTAQRTIDVASLGRQASDERIFEFARQAGAVLVTINRGDFISLAGRGRQHPGMILLPSVPRAESRRLLRAALVAAEPLMAQSPNLSVEIDATGAITRFRLP